MRDKVPRLLNGPGKWECMKKSQANKQKRSIPACKTRRSEKQTGQGLRFPSQTPSLDTFCTVPVITGAAATLGFYIWSIYHRRPQPRTGSNSEIEEPIIRSPYTNCKLGITNSAEHPCPVGSTSRGVPKFYIACMKRHRTSGHLQSVCIGGTARLFRVQAITSIA